MTRQASFDQLLSRYAAAPPHALLLTSRRFAAGPQAVERDLGNQEEGSDQGSSSDEEAQNGLLSGLEIEALSRVLCGFAGDPQPHSPGPHGASPQWSEHHPDFYAVDRTRKNLRLEEINPIFTRICYPPMRAKRRLILIEQAQRLTPHAANALLKSIEEPLTSVLFVLTAPSPAHLMPTIVSRCVRLHVPADQLAARACDLIAPTTRESLRQIVNRIAFTPLDSLLVERRGNGAKAAPRTQDRVTGALSPQQSLASTSTLGEQLAEIDALARSATPELLIAAMLELVVDVRRTQQQQQHSGLPLGGTAWLVERLRQWKRSLDYNPSTALRLTEFVVAGNL